MLIPIIIFKLLRQSLNTTLNNIMASKITYFAIIMLLWGMWVYLEQKYIKEPLFALSVSHIKYFRAQAETNPLLDKIAGVFSFLGDKYGCFICGIGS